jgi:tetratricopeptide (TPR) repeat protein
MAVSEQPHPEIGGANTLRATILSPMKPVYVALLTLVLVAGCGGIPRIQKPASFPSDRVVLSYRLVAEGDRLLEEGKDHLAMLKYVEAADANPYHEVIFNKLAISYSRLQMYDQASRAVRRSIGLRPDYSYAYNTMGIVSLAQGDDRGALRALRKAVQLDPAVASFRVNLGHAHMQRSEFAEGLAEYRKALELDPEVFSRSDAVQLPFPGDDRAVSERFYQMAKFFAGQGDKDASLLYLGRALSAGFSDGERLGKETAFEKLRDDEEFLRLLNLYGIRLQAS